MDTRILDKQMEMKKIYEVMDTRILDIQIEVAKILEEENEYMELVRKRREWKINYILKEKKEEDEKEYFD